MAKKHKNNNEFAEVIALGVLTFFVIFIILWVAFWIWVICLIIGIFFLVNKINYELDFYYTPYCYAAILSYVIWWVITLFIIWLIWTNLWKIDTTFFEWAKLWSNYVSVTKKWWYPSMEINKEWIAQEAIVSQIQNENIKQVVEIPNKFVDWISNKIHDSFINFIKKIFSNN